MAKFIGRWLVTVMAVAAMTLAGVAGTGLAQAQTSTSTDREALVALYNATDGLNWRNNTNWLSGRPLGEWHGVTTDSNRRVTHLDLRSNNLSGRIPPELGNLSNLEEMILGDNPLSGRVPSELGNLSKLRVLDLSVTNLSGPLPDSFTGLASLSFIGISRTGGLCAPTDDAFQAWLAGVAQKFEVVACTADPIFDRYDTNGNNRMDRGEVIAAINDYLFGEGDGVISRSDVIRLINLYLFAPSTPHNRPGAPTGLTAAGNGQTRIDLSWSAPASDGGAAITGYRIEVSENGSTWTDLVANTRNAATSYSHTGLTAGSTRHYRVSAINSAGTGPASNIATGTTAGDAATDRAALAALYNATDGANWQNSGNWLSNTPMGGWHGVTTDSDGRVSQLLLGSNQLTGEIPAELGSLPSLERLDLYGNQLTGEIPVELGSLTNLERLDLSINQLSGKIPAELGSLTNLQELYLSDNQLSGEIPAGLGSLTNLVWLDLFINQLSGEMPAELGSLTNLGYLYLNNNQLTGEIPAELGGLSGLKHLFLGENGLTGCIPEGLRNVPYNDLDELGLADCASAIASGQSKASFQNFHVIDVELDEYGDHDRECRTRLGSKYRLADWNDLKDYYTSGSSIPELIAGLNWKDENTPDVGVRNPRVARNGEVRFGSRRHYFVARHDHAPPGYFLVHDDIDDYHLSLGSWYGQGGEALCYKTG